MLLSQTKNWVRVSTKTYYDSCKKEKIILNQLAYSTPNQMFPNVNTKEFGTALWVGLSILLLTGTQQIQYYGF